MVLCNEKRFLAPGEKKVPGGKRGARGKTEAVLLDASRRNVQCALYHVT